MKKNKPDLKAVGDAPAEIKLNAKQVKELAEIERKGLAAKVSIADVTEQILIAENRRRQMFEDLYKVNGEYQAKVQKYASAAGIDVDADPQVTGERFEFVPATSAFVRIPVPKAEPQQ